MEGFRGVIVMASVVLLGLCNVGAQQEQGACVRYYLCEIVAEGPSSMSKRSEVGQNETTSVKNCSDPLDVWCTVPLKDQNRTSVGTTEHTSTIEQPLIPPEVDIPRAVTEGCGIRREVPTASSSSSQHEVNTVASHYVEFPWMMALFAQESEAETKLKCGATLIDPEVVVTAAHCVAGVDKMNLTVRGGNWNSESVIEPLPHQNRSIKQIIIHPEFNSSNLYNDIALLIVDSPFEMTDNVDVICWPHPDWNFEKARCVVAGWGNDSSVGAVNKRIPQKVELAVISKDQCQEQLRKTRLGENFTLHESFVCTEGETGKDACQGTDGSPLICPLPEDPKRWTLAGIVSWRTGCGDESPSVYTDLSHFLEWIIS